MVTYLGFFGTARLNQSRPLGCGKYCVAESQWVEPVDNRQMQIVRPLAQQPWGKVCNRLCRLSCQVYVGEVELFEEGEAGKEEERGKSFAFKNFSCWLSVCPEAWFGGEAVEMPAQIITRFFRIPTFPRGGLPWCYCYAGEVPEKEGFLIRTFYRPYRMGPCRQV